MKTKKLKYIIWSLVISMATQSLTAQSISRTGYFMDNATFRHLMNPALTPEKGYISIPVLGSLSMGMESNLLISDFLYPSATGTELMTFLHPDVDAGTFLSKLDPVNYIRSDIRTSLLSMGLKTKIGFFTFDVASRINISMDIPYEMFSFLKLGMTSGQGNEYLIQDMNFNAGAYIETSLGFSRNVMENLRIGAKLKYLSGIANINANIKKLDVNMTPDEWSISSDIMLDVYGKGLSFKKDNDQVINGVDINSPGIGGSGLAVDLGVVYSPIKNLDISLGLVDLGSITWAKDNVKHAGANGSFEFSGLDGIGIDSVADKSVEDQIDQLQKDAENMLKPKEIASTGKEKQKLFATINAGAQYKLADDKVGVGLLYTGRLRSGGTYSELMASASYKPINWFQVVGSYSFMHSKFKTFGLALNLTPGFVNFFLACDYLVLNKTPQYFPLNTSNTNIQLGLAIPIGK
jgi:hypothetical protein